MNVLRTIFAVVVVVVVVVVIAAVHAHAAPAAEALAIRHARVFDGSAVTEDLDVLVRDGVIAQLGKNLAASDAKVIDAAGKTLLPGLIDAHVHIQSPDVLRQAAALGVTTELDMFMSVALAKELRAEENFARADFRTAGTLATAPGGHGTQYGVTIETLTAPHQAEKFVDARLAEGSDYIKIIYDDGASVGMTFAKLSRETMAAVIAAAHAKGKLAVVHVIDQRSAREAIEAGADGLVHVFVDEPADPALLKLAKEKNVFVIPTLAVMENYGRDEADTPLAADPHLAPMMTKEDAAALRVRFPRRGNVRASVKTAIENVAALNKAGVRILAGTDTPNPGTLHGLSLHREIELLIDAGLSPTDALKAATSVPAEAFKLADRGRIAQGKRADLVLVDGDPTKDIKATRAIEQIWIAGRSFDRDGYRTMIDQRNKTLAALVAPGPLLVSDFEDGPDLHATFGAGWSVSTDQIQRGKSTADLKIVDGGADGSRHALLIKGSINPPLPWAWAGAMFSPGPRIMAPADLSGKKSISFWARGDGKPARIMLFSRSTGFAPAFETFTPGEQWQRHTFEIKQFRDMTGKDLIMVIFAGGVEHGPFEYRIDQVMFE